MKPTDPQEETSNVVCLSTSVERHIRDYFQSHQGTAPAAGLYERVLREIEKPLLEICLMECQGNQLKAAALLGLNRNTLRKKIRELDIVAKERRQT
jgi:two-component system, NtrC family, nitrogen regulation response regulator GlnG